MFFQRQLKPNTTVEEVFDQTFFTLDGNVNPIGFPFVVSVKKSQTSFSHLSTVCCSYARFSVQARQLFANGESELNNMHEALFDVEKFKLDRDVSIEEEQSTYKSPHLVYYKSTHLNQNDMRAPFVFSVLFAGEESLIIPERIDSCNAINGDEALPLMYFNDKPMNLSAIFYVAMVWLNQDTSHGSLQLMHKTPQLTPIDITIEKEITLDDCIDCYFHTEKVDMVNKWLVIESSSRKSFIVLSLQEMPKL